MKELTCEQCGKRVDGVSELWLHYGKCPNGIKAVYTNNSQLKEMKEEDIKRIEEAAREYHNKTMCLSDASGLPFGQFKAGAEYEHPIAYEAGFQDGFKKMDNELYNQAIEDVIEKVNLLKTMDIIFDTSVIKEIQKLKKP